MLVVLPDIEVNGAIDFVGKSAGDKLLHDLDLFDDVTGGRRFDARWKDVELTHYRMEVFGVSFDDLHWFELFEACFLGDLVFAVIGIVLQVADICYVANIADFVPEETQVTRNDVEGQKSSDVTQVDIIINCWSTDIHADPSLDLWCKLFFRSGE